MTLPPRGGASASPIAATMTDEEAGNRATYDAFAAAWFARDLDALMALVTDDVVYGASVGPEPGRTFRGGVEVRKGFSVMLALDDAASSEVASALFAGSVACVEWQYTRLGEPAPSVRGIDRLEFRGGRISRKEAYRKVTSA